MKTIVKSCKTCPLQTVIVTHWGCQDTQAICQHPEVAGKALAPENDPVPDEVPEWCPLRFGVLMVEAAP